MKEYLHLFTELKDGLPTEKGYYLARFYNYYNGSEKIMPFVYEKGYDFDNGTWRISHWLDLSKLTTKEELAKAVAKVVEEHSNCYGAADAMKDMAANYRENHE